MATKRFQYEDCNTLNSQLIFARYTNSKNYNLPIASEITALIVGDFDSSCPKRDLILETQSLLLKWISELHPFHIPLQYPLLFPCGEDRYREDVVHVENNLLQSRHRTKLTSKERLAFGLQDHNEDKSILMYSRQLMHQFIVNGYTMIESKKLKYIKMHQKQLRVELYKGLLDAILHGYLNRNSTSKHVILPSSFTSGAKFMIQNYQDTLQ